MKQLSTSKILTIFLLGIFIGALDSGIVSPAREIIQNSFGVSASDGTWMLTIYTLFYAVSMPIVSKLADRIGYKPVYIGGILLFGLGSFLTGLTNFYGNYELFLIARVIQAVGAGGIIPIANAVIGHTFPEEKRGFALGMIGGMYGIATILGPTVGSFILQIVGVSAWGWLFFINVPFCLTIIVLSMTLSNEKSDSKAPMDLLGALVLTGVIGSLMYALTNIDLFDLSNSIANTDVWPFLVGFAVLLPVLIWVENRAKDPILNLKYFTDPQMLMTLLIGFIVGIGMMGMVFVPQFGENVLKLKAGTGGYLVTLLAVFSGIAAPLSGKMLDKWGGRTTLLTGFSFNIAGTLWMSFVVSQHLGFPALFVGLALMGLGVGFTMGAPLNYMVLKAVPKEEGTSALATLSVIRSIGVTLSPSLMIGFIVSAAKNLQTNLMDVLSKSFEGMMPNGMAFANTGDGSAFKGLMSADVTTVTDLLKDALASSLPEKIKPMITSGIEQNRLLIETTFQSTINEGYAMMFLAAALIAVAGLVITYLLKDKNEKSSVSSQNLHNQEV